MAKKEKGFASFKKLNVFIPSKEIQSLKIGEILIREIRNTRRAK